MHNRRSFLQASLAAGVAGWSSGAFGQEAQGIEHGARLSAAGFRGEIVTPASPRYARLCQIFVVNPRRTTRPQLFAICANEADVARAISYGRSTGLELAVRSGGHDLLGASLCNGIVIDLSALQSIEVDPARRTVRVGAGVRAGPLNAALSERGLAAALGCAGQVGVTGLVLGGGLGWLVGRHGAACDHLVAARMVTADGRMLSITENEHPDLLWALRGGGGNFGIVTEMTLAVHPLPSVIQGTIALSLDRPAGFLRRYSDFLAESGDDLDLETYILAPRGEPMAFIKACYYGDPGRAERALGPLRRLAPVAADDIGPRRYNGQIDMSEPVATVFRSAPPVRRDDDVPGLHVASVSLVSIRDDPARIIEERIARARGGWIAGFGHYVHGAALGVSPEHSPMRRIDRHLTTYYLTNWRRSEDARAQMSWADETAFALRPHAAPTYINYLTLDGEREVRRAYGRAYSRLAGIKRNYDAQNVFRRNRNVIPANA